MCGIAATRAQESNVALGLENKTVDSAGATIRINVNRVPVGVTVSDARGHFIRGLRREDFKIFDEGREQPISAFASSEEPAHLIFMIESGTSSYLLAKLGRSLFAGAETLLAGISTKDQVAIITYSNRPQLVFDFTADKPATELALKELNFKLMHSRSSAGRLNLSSSIAETLDWLAPIPGNKTLVLLSSGIDASPPETWPGVQERIKTSDVRILAVSAFGDLRKPAKAKRLTREDRAERAWLKQNIAESDQALHQIAASTGGQIYFPSNAREFVHAYEEIGQLARGEYSLEFVPPRLDGRIHALSVKLKHSGYRVNHRKAYLAPTPRSPN